MLPIACPTCGSSVPSAAAGAPAICPGCCALLSGEPIPRERRPKPILRMPLGRDPSAPGAARHALAGLRPELGDSRFRVCELLASELVMNVLHHAPARSAWGAADLRVRKYPDRVRVEVRDDGLGFMPRERAPDQDLESGWGLHLVRELADDWGVEPGVQNCVWFSLALA